MTVIIPSWQTRDLLVECLAGLADCRELRRVVVDNASTDGSADAAAGFDGVQVIRHAANSGFAAAVNAGLAVALASGDGPAILLNPDTRCSPEALAVLAAHLAQHPRTGLVAPRLLLPDGRPQPFAFGGDPTLRYLLRRGWRRWRGGGYLHDWADDSTFAADWVSFACVAARLEMVRQVGLLDTGFFMYFEDNDWCLRARRAGWAVERTGAASIIHIGGASLGRNPAAAAAYRRSLLLFHAKHYGPASRLAVRLILPLYAARFG